MIIESLFDCLCLCIERGFALKVHRDAGCPVVEDSSDKDCAASIDTAVNLGNYKSIIQFVAKRGDIVLQEHLQKHAKNASYISNSSQVDMLECVFTELQRLIVEEAKNQHWQVYILLMQMQMK